MSWNCWCLSDYYLNKKNNTNTDLYTLEGLVLRAKVVDVYDGDTCTVIFKLNKRYEKHKVRMYGYDSPEMKPSRSDPNRDEIKKKAKYAKKLLEEKILNKIVILRCGKWDKYGRLLGSIYINGGCFSKNENVNEWMVDNNFGKPYFGGKKE